METIGFSEMSTNNHLSKWRHTTEYSNIKIDINWSCTVLLNTTQCNRARDSKRGKAA